MADVIARLSVRPRQGVSDQWQFKLRVTLSDNTLGTTNRITYYFGGDDLSAESSDDHRYVALPEPEEGTWTELVMPLTDDAAAFEEWDDQSALAWAFELAVQPGATAELDMDGFELDWELEGEGLRDYQQALADEQYSGGGVTHFVGQELSLVIDAGHVNPLGEDQVPLPDMVAQGFIRRDEAVAYVHEQGGLAQCNHPFGSEFELTMDEADADAYTRDLSQKWITEAGYGCDLVEVGYLEREVDLLHHLRFWDTLGRAGLTVTGVGSSDNHWANDWLDFVDPYVTWVYQDLPTRGGIADELAVGRAFFGDPGPFVGNEPLLDLWSEHGAVMGQVLATDLDQILHVETGYLDPGWTLALVVDGEDYSTIELAGDEVDTVVWLPREEYEVVRAEVRDHDGVPILISNPIYLVTAEDTDDVDPTRLAPG